MSKMTKILVGVLVLVIILAAYVYMSGDGGSSTAPADTGTPGLTTNGPTGVEEETATGQKFLATLLRLKELNINRAIFEDPAFTSLRDYGVTLIPEAAGRNNPFAPLGQGTAFAGPSTPGQNVLLQGSQQTQGASLFSAQPTVQAPVSTNIKQPASAPAPKAPTTPVNVQATAPQTQAGSGVPAATQPKTSPSSAPTPKPAASPTLPPEGFFP